MYLYNSKPLTEFRQLPGFGYESFKSCMELISIVSGIGLNSRSVYASRNQSLRKKLFNSDGASKQLIIALVCDPETTCSNIFADIVPVVKDRSRLKIERYFF